MHWCGQPQAELGAQKARELLIFNSLCCGLSLTSVFETMTSWTTVCPGVVQQSLFNEKCLSMGHDGKGLVLFKHLLAQ